LHASKLMPHNGQNVYLEIAQRMPNVQMSVVWNIRTQFFFSMKRKERRKRKYHSDIVCVNPGAHWHLAVLINWFCNHNLLGDMKMKKIMFCLWFRPVNSSHCQALSRRGWYTFGGAHSCADRRKLWRLCWDTTAGNRKLAAIVQFTGCFKIIVFLWIDFQIHFGTENYQCKKKIFF